VNSVRNKDEALWTRFAHKIILKYKDDALLENMVKSDSLKSTRSTVRSMYQTYHDIVSIQCIITWAVSVGIIEPPTIGIAADILRLTLNESKTDGLKNTSSPRNFGRIMMCLKQFIYASVVIKKYMMRDDGQVMEFKYEDLVDMERIFI